MFIVLIAILIGLITYIWWVYEYKFYEIRKHTDKIPGPKPWPIVGNSLDFMNVSTELWPYINNQAKIYGRLFKVHFPGQIIVFISDPKDLENYFKDQDNISKTDVLVEFFKPWLGNGLLFNTGAPWREMRKILTPSFHFNNIQMFSKVFNEQADILVNRLQPMANEKDEINFLPIMHDYGLDCVVETIMGGKINAQTQTVDNEYVAAVHEINRIIAIRQSSLVHQIPWIYPFTKLARSEKRCIETLHGTSQKIIKERKKVLDYEKSIGKESPKRTLLDILLTTNHSNGSPITFKEVCDEVEMFMFAGHDTASTQMSYLVFDLSQHQEIQKKLFQEQCDVLGGELNRDPTQQELQEMNYLECAIKESQRKNSVVGLIIRGLVKDMVLQDKFIAPKGVTVGAFLHNVHHDPELFPEPEKFDPDRFLPENKDKIVPYSYAPFSLGPRNCIGLRFAMLEMKICISKLIRNYEILPVWQDGKMFKPIINIDILTTSTNGLPVRLKPRNTTNL